MVCTWYTVLHVMFDVVVDPRIPDVAASDGFHTNYTRVTNV